MMRILITGAGGFVGSYLIPELCSAGHEVVAASHRSMVADGVLGIEVFDIRDRQIVHEVLSKYEPEGVIHLAAQASVPQSWTDPAETYEINVVGTGNLLQALKETDTRVLLIGSAQEYGSAGGDRPIRETDELRPNSPYALSKLTQELMGMIYHDEFGLPVVMARPFNHTGPGQSTEYAVGAFCSQIVEIEKGELEPRLHVGRLDSVRDFLDARDVVEAYRLLIESGTSGQVYNVSSGEGRRIGDLLKILLAKAELSSEVEVVESGEARKGDPLILIGENSKIVNALGWRPKIALEDSLLATLDWYRSRSSS